MLKTLSVIGTFKTLSMLLVSLDTHMGVLFLGNTKVKAAGVRPALRKPNKNHVLSGPNVDFDLHPRICNLAHAQRRLRDQDSHRVATSFRNPSIAFSRNLGRFVALSSWSFSLLGMTPI